MTALKATSILLIQPAIVYTIFLSADTHKDMTALEATDILVNSHTASNCLHRTSI